MDNVRDKNIAIRVNKEERALIEKMKRKMGYKSTSSLIVSALKNLSYQLGIDTRNLSTNRKQ